MKNEPEEIQVRHWEWCFLAISIMCFSYGISSIGVQNKNSSKISQSDIPSKVLKNSSILAHGNSGAPWNVVEFMDYECPPCKAMDATARQMVSQSNGQLSWEVSSLPLPMHYNAPALSIIAILGKEREVFPKIHNVLLENQSKPYFWKEAEASGLLSMSRDSLKSRIRDQSEWFAMGALAKGTMIGIEGTPEIFLISPDKKVWIVKDPKLILSFIRANAGK